MDVLFIDNYKELLIFKFLFIDKIFNGKERRKNFLVNIIN